MDSYLEQSFAAIAEDNISGAAEIAALSAELILRQARTSEESSVDLFRERMLRLGWQLIASHSTMAPLVNLVNQVLWAIEDCPTPQALRQQVAETTQEFKRRLRVHEAAIGELALALIPEGSTVLTNGRSTTVRSALLHAQRAGRRFNVVCAEARPGCEGRTMTRELAEAGLPVKLVIDALAIAQVAQVNLVLVGADHLTHDGLVNKVGTYGIALAAHRAEVPVYTLCGSEKFLPPGYVPPHQSSWPREQVWPEAPERVAIENLYFDRTPLTHIAGIVTEQGVTPPVGIEAWLASIKLHPALRQ